MWCRNPLLEFWCAPALQGCVFVESKVGLACQAAKQLGTEKKSQALGMRRIWFNFRGPSRLEEKGSSPRPRNALPTTPVDSASILRMRTAASRFLIKCAFRSGQASHRSAPPDRFAPPPAD